MATCNPKSRLQERALSTRPQLGEFKQLVRARIAQKGKELRLQKTMQNRVFRSEPTNTMEIDENQMECDQAPQLDYDLRAWLQQQWLEFAREEGIDELSIEDHEDLLSWQAEVLQFERAAYEQFLLEQYEKQQELEEQTLNEQIEAYERECYLRQQQGL